MHTEGHHGESIPSPEKKETDSSVRREVMKGWEAYKDLISSGGAHIYTNESDLMNALRKSPSGHFKLVYLSNRYGEMKHPHEVDFIWPSDDAEEVVTNIALQEAREDTFDFSEGVLLIFPSAKEDERTTVH